jgi:hypothetical protein
MSNAGNRFTAVALPAGQPGSNRVDVFGLFDVTVFATQDVVEFDALV